MLKFLFWQISGHKKRAVTTPPCTLNLITNLTCYETLKEGFYEKNFLFVFVDAKINAFCVKFIEVSLRNVKLVRLLF